MSESILVINAGSSSVKFALFDQATNRPDITLKGQVSGIGTAPAIEAFTGDGDPVSCPQSIGGIVSHSDAFDTLLDWFGERGEQVVGAGHRVVHGGAGFTAPVRVDENIIKAFEALIHLAPHHQPHNILAIRALASRYPNLPQVACFDTAFHASQPPEAKELGLPPEYNEKGLRRYGFHGLSYESVLTALPVVMGQAVPSRLVIAHLGNGASMCAVKDGQCIATTMGFSTLDGIPMGTRSGAIDPGVLLHLMREDGATLSDLEDLLYNKSGLLGISGFSADMRVLLASDEEQAASAVAFYCYRISRELGSLAAALGGLDALVFTGGIGENAAPVRARILQSSSWLGLELDEGANEKSQTRITYGKSNTHAWVVPTDEELSIARHTLRVLGR
jgi:acetate kinase